MTEATRCCLCRDARFLLQRKTYVTTLPLVPPAGKLHVHDISVIMTPAETMDTPSDQDSTDLSEASRTFIHSAQTAFLLILEVLQMQQLLDTRSLELAYEKSLRQTNIIYEIESARQLRVRILLLEDENDDLHEQLALGDNRIDILERSVQDVQDQLEIAGESLQRVQSDLRMKTREVETLKVILQCNAPITTAADNGVGRITFHDRYVHGCDQAFDGEAGSGA